MNVNTYEVSQKLTEAMEKVRERFEAQEDHHAAAKLQQLIEKKHVGVFQIAFCGHFSAGKSSILNLLCTHPMLPSSPRPTSANIVSIRNGEPLARVRLKNKSTDDAEQQNSSYQAIRMDEIEAYCKNGDDIEEVELSYPLPWLGDKGILIDTPGIDSTDEAHFQATDSILHLADVVFYVMDYNYVQSELNLAFAKKMKDWGKPLYLIVNMIDKHKEQEIPFLQFQQTTREAFAQYGIAADGFLYVSTKQPTHLHNDWVVLTSLLHQLLKQRELWGLSSIDGSFRYLISEHIVWIDDNHESLRVQWREQLSVGDDPITLEAEIDRLNQRHQFLQHFIEDFDNKIRQEISKTIENANITPALTRDRAHVYLETRKPGFKVGFLNRHAQTLAEAEKRMEAFRSDFAAQVQAQLDWHLKDMLKKIVQVHERFDTPIDLEIESLSWDVSPTWLAEQVLSSATMSHEYTLNYMKQVASACKQIYRKKSYEVVDHLVELLRHDNQNAMITVENQLEMWRTRLHAIQELQLIDARVIERKEQLHALSVGTWQEELMSIKLKLQAQVHHIQLEHAEQAEQAEQAGIEPAHKQDTTSGAEAVTLHQLEPSPTMNTSVLAATRDEGNRSELKALALQAASALIENIPSMKSLSLAMRSKAERLAKQSFTIALFGAFSAGKSSFANALLGSRTLPVSPNPTTAAINRIVWPQPNWPQGTAKVKMKSHEAIFQDMQYSFKILGYDVTELSAALRLIPSLNPATTSSKGRTHLHFLRSVEMGWKQMESQLGSEVRITSVQFADYVAKESMSCFIESIELYDENAWTKQNIVLVDTPGADSINARHTGVAFTYMKNADAILFVTYYNHAFSQADREFLLQLGRVKDSFEMDKMFFIVNASDLASDAAELAQVLTHMDNNLLHHGIRYPRIYPVSSLLALEARLDGDIDRVQASGIQAFEADFNTFIIDELRDIALRAADQDIEQAIFRMNQWIDGARDHEHQRKARIEQLQLAQTQAIQELQHVDFLLAHRDVRKEIQELLYYVKQRTMYRFGELYQIVFNPSSFREYANQPKVFLRLSSDELHRMIARHIHQEVLATTLRIENSIHAIAAQLQQVWEKQVNMLITDISWTEDEKQSFDTPELHTPIQLPELTDKLLFGYFKNSTYFFEAEGNKQLRNEIEQHWTNSVELWMTQQVEELICKYEEVCQSHLEARRERMYASIYEHTKGMCDALDMKMDIPQLQSTLQQLHQLMNEPFKTNI